MILLNNYVPQIGDVINTESNPPNSVLDYVKFWNLIVRKGIISHQKSLGFKYYTDTHTRLVIDTNHIFSCTFPVTKWDNWDDVKKERFYIYRPTFELNLLGQEILTQTAYSLIGTRYDVGQLFDIMLNQLLHYRVSKWKTYFDFGAQLYVCSVASRVCFETVRKEFKRLNLTPPFDVLFDRNCGKKLNVERTTPADVTDSKWFKLITQHQKGNRGYVQNAV